MVRRHYPLNALRAFEAAARHLSFVKAADELSVTPAAVSHQVKRLEEYLGTQLFQRRPRRLLLAETGQLLATELRDVFLGIDKAMERVRKSDSHGALTVSVAPMFAVKWLLPRLQRFDELHPSIDLRVSSSLGLIDFQRDTFDAAVRLGPGRYAGLESVKLFDESVTPMCSPRIFADSGGLATPNDLRHHILLHDDSMAYDAGAPTWDTWLEAAGTEKIDASRGPRFSQPDHAIQAAIDGAGIALGWCYLATDDLAAGRLVAPFDLHLPLGSSFCLVYPETHTNRPKVTLFRDWLLKESGSELSSHYVA